MAVIRITPPAGTVIFRRDSRSGKGEKIIADGSTAYDSEKFIPSDEYRAEWDRQFQQTANEQRIAEDSPERQEFLKQNAIAQAQASGDTTILPQEGFDSTALEESDEYKALNADQQELVGAVFEGVATNDAKKAAQFAEALKKAELLNDPYFSSLLRLASDTIQRGFVSLENETAFKEEQLRNNLSDLQDSIANQQEFLSLDEMNVLRGIEREFGVALEDTRQNLAASGFGASSRRAQKEELLGAEREDITESTTRKFAFQQDQAAAQLAQGERDTALEAERLAELAQEGRLDLLRQAEGELGTGNLGNLADLAGTPALGDIAGRIPEAEAKDNLSTAAQLTF